MNRSKKNWWISEKNMMELENIGIEIIFKKRKEY